MSTLGAVKSVEKLEKLAQGVVDRGKRSTATMPTPVRTYAVNGISLL